MGSSKNAPGRFGFSGNDNTKFRENGEKYAINLQLDGANATSIEDVKRFNVKNSRGAKLVWRGIVFG